jgi:hypothetical protein
VLIDPFSTTTTTTQSADGNYNEMLLDEHGQQILQQQPPKQSCLVTRFRYDAVSEQLPRRLALRVNRSLRIFGSYLALILLPVLLTSVVQAQVSVVNFYITTKPQIANHVYDRLNILTSSVPFMIVWWLCLWLLTKAVFLRSGLLKYVCIGFTLSIKACFVLFPLQIVANRETDTIPDPNGNKDILPQLVAILPPFFSAAMWTQINIFTLSLGFCVLPRPIFPIAISVLSICFGIGELTAIRIGSGGMLMTDSTASGFPLIATLFICTLLILVLYLWIVKKRNGFANPRALLMKMKQEALDEDE